MVVIDCGCVGWAEEISIEKLVERFRPEVLYAFDPYPELTNGMYMIGDTRVIRERTAAWLFNGVIGYKPDGTRSHIVTGFHNTVPCFDLAVFIQQLKGPVVLKLDVEGAEYPLLDRIIETEADELLDLILVEWHDQGWLTRERRDHLTVKLRCPVEPW